MKNHKREKLETDLLTDFMRTKVDGGYMYQHHETRYGLSHPFFVFVPSDSNEDVTDKIHEIELVRYILEDGYEGIFRRMRVEGGYLHNYSCCLDEWRNEWIFIKGESF